jgi:hypothetical protein
MMGASNEMDCLQKAKENMQKMEDLRDKADHAFNALLTLKIPAINHETQRALEHVAFLMYKCESTRGEAAKQNLEKVNGYIDECFHMLSLINLTSISINGYFSPSKMSQRFSEKYIQPRNKTMSVSDNF